MVLQQENFMTLFQRVTQYDQELDRNNALSRFKIYYKLRSTITIVSK